MARTATPPQRLKALGNTHKWFLGGGRRVIWAPEFPTQLHRPGFWDHGTYLELKLEGLLTYALLDGGSELELTQQGRDWQPDRLRCRYTAPGLSVIETRSITPDDSFTSALEIKNRTGKARTLDLILWGRIEATDRGTPQFSDVRARPTGVTGLYQTFDKEQQLEHALKLKWSLRTPRGRGGCTSAAALVSEPGGPTPDFCLSPFYEIFDGKLPGISQWEGGIDRRHGDRPLGKFVFIGLHQRVRLAARGSATLIGACQVSPATPARPVKARIPDWERFFAQTPVFECDDPYFQKYYDYRWYGLRINAVDAGIAPLTHPCVFEGINAGWFRHAISYSAQVLPRDCRWLHDPALARGNVLNFLEAQEPSGFIHGGLLTGAQSKQRHTGHMYHSDWGGVVRAIHEVHPDRRFLEQCYAPLCQYAEYFQNKRDTEESGLFDVRNQAETGQEYMSRYLFVDPRADEWGPFQLKGVDATVYLYSLFQNLAWIAAEVGHAEDVPHWQHYAHETGTAVLEQMWDPRRDKFCDVHPATGKRSPARALTDFYPFLTDLAGQAHVGALRRHLLDKRAFWTAFPAPSTALDDKTADVYGRWLGKRMNCPWNGRTWLMTNSHIAEVLALATLHLDRRLERYATEFLRRYIRMLFVDRDLDRPTSYEYYNAVTGQAPFFRGTEEYMHSWIIDLLIKYVVGLRPRADRRIIVEPLDFGLRRFSLTNCRVAGRPVEVSWNGKTLTAKVGRQTQRSRGLGRLEFTL